MKKTRNPAKLLLDRKTVAVLSDPQLISASGGLMRCASSQSRGPYDGCGDTTG